MAYYMYCPLDLTVKQQHIYTLLYNQSAFKDNFRVPYTVQQLTVDSDKCFGMTERIVSTIIKQLISKGYLKEVVKGKKGFATVYEIQVNHIINGDQCVSNVSPMCNQSVSNSEPIPTVSEISGNQSVSNVYANGNQCVNPIIKDNEKDNEKQKEHDRFAEFWSIYPRKENRKKAVAAFGRMTNKEIDLAIEDVKLRSESQDWKKDGGKFIPHPTSYINGKRWEDEKVINITSNVKKPHAVQPADPIRMERRKAWD